MLPDILSETEAKIIRIFRRPESIVIHLIQALFSRNLKVGLEKIILLLVLSFTIPYLHVNSGSFSVESSIKHAHGCVFDQSLHRILQVSALFVLILI